MLDPFKGNVTSCTRDSAYTGDIMVQIACHEWHINMYGWNNTSKSNLMQHRNRVDFETNKPANLRQYNSHTWEYNKLQLCCVIWSNIASVFS